MIIVQIVFFTLALFFSCFGLAQALRSLSRFVFRKERENLITVLPLKGEDTEMLLRCATAACSVEPCCTGIFALDCGLSEDEYRVARRFCSEHSGIELISREKFLLEVLNGTDPSRTG